MKISRIVTIAGILVTLVTLMPGLSLSDVASLRGDNALDQGAASIEKKKQAIQSGGFERSWELQPPSVPHSIDKDRISAKENTCLSCHNKTNFEKENAPEVAESHYQDRDGNVLEKISSRRWFCGQCHTPQVDAAPLINNTF